MNYNKGANLKKIVKPRNGLLVRDPITKGIVPEDGMKVQWTGPNGTYWKRRVLQGDCELVDKDI